MQNILVKIPINNLGQPIIDLSERNFLVYNISECSNAGDNDIFYILDGEIILFAHNTLVIIPCLSYS